MAFTYDGASLTYRVRQLINVFTSDLLNDAEILQVINEEYFELSTKQKWSWTASSTLLTNTVPTIPAEFQLILAYKAAVKLLKRLGDTSGRLESYTQTASQYESDLVTYDLTGKATGNNSTLYTDIDFVRNLLGIYDKSVSDDFILTTLNRVLEEVRDSQKWPFTILTNSTPAYAASLANFTNPWFVAYKAAAVIGSQLGIDPAKVQTFESHYDELYKANVEFVFNKNGSLDFNPFSEATQEASLVKGVRTVLNVFDDSISNSFIANKLREEYLQFHAKYASNDNWSPYTTLYAPPAKVHVTVNTVLNTMTEVIFGYDNFGEVVSRNDEPLAADKYDFTQNLLITTVNAGTWATNGAAYAATFFAGDKLFSPIRYPFQLETSILDFSKMNSFNDGTFVYSPHNSYIGFTDSTRIINDPKLFVYGVAVRISMAMGMPETSTREFQAEYDTILDRIKMDYFANNTTYNNVTFAALVEKAQAYAGGKYDEKFSKLMLMKMLWNENVLLMNERDWAFNNNEILLQVPANLTLIDLSTIITFNTTVPLSKLHIKGMWEVIGAGEKRSIKPRDTMLDVGLNSSETYYHMFDATNLQIYPAFTKPTYITIKFSIPESAAYTNANNYYNTLYATYDVQFMDIIVYRLAAKLAIYNNDANVKNVVPMLLQMANDLRDSMITYYETEHSNEPISIGGSSDNTPKYMPLFTVQ
jgi:hypothetical protein